MTLCVPRPVRGFLVLAGLWLGTGLNGCLGLGGDPDPDRAARGWLPQDSGLAAARLQDVHFPDADTGYAVGDSILKTVDGGKTWSVLDAGSEYLTAVFFVDGRRGWVAGARGTVFRTSNGGEAWFPADAQMRGDARGLYFTGPLTGFCVGDDGSISRTSDGGATWSARDIEEDSLVGRQALWAVSFPSPDTGYATGDRGFLVRTVDGGDTWRIHPLPTQQDLYDVQFVTITTGYAAGAGGGHGSVHKTTDAGESWTDVSGASAASQGHLSLHFLDARTGWVTGDFGETYRTTNGGAAWSRQHTPTGNTLRSVHFIDARRGWAVVLYGGLIATVTGGED
jgi:photosystem II stability/assembly factor-like uncharacterized protein